MKHRLFKWALLLSSLAVSQFSASVSALAGQDSFTSMIQITGNAQSSLTKQMIRYNGMYPQGSSGGPAPCMPPYELQRGPAAIVPPELQGDPRYQEYLRCLRTQPGPQYNPQGAPQYAPVARHQAIEASDFVPAMSGHPVAEQAIAGMPINGEQRLMMQNAVTEVFNQVANNYRRNNLAVAMAFAYATANGVLTGTSANPQQVRESILSINDAIAQDPNFPRMPALEKQNTSDSLIFQSAMMLLLQNMGQQDPDARQKSIDLAHMVMRRLTGS